MMTIAEAAIRPPNSLVLIGDPSADPPESMCGRLVASTSSCLAIGTLSDVDGETTIRLVDADDPTPLSPRLAFDGTLRVPHACLKVTSVLGDTYLERNIPDRIARLRVWVNEPIEPDEICIVVCGQGRSGLAA